VFLGIPLTSENLSPRRKLPAPTTTATCGPSLHISAILLAIDSRAPPSIPNSPALQKLWPESFNNTRLYLLFAIFFFAAEIFNIVIPAKAGIHFPFILIFLCALGVLCG
jgi:hypothetical protein